MKYTKRIHKVGAGVSKARKIHRTCEGGYTFTYNIRGKVTAFIEVSDDNKEFRQIGDGVNENGTVLVETGDIAFKFIRVRLTDGSKGHCILSYAIEV
ncbi:hypothetical protein NVP1209O_06 [Vibrio phage 1.209.O._10N.222.52.B2]|nr:hypothetical protein NVP1209O_06 [Vibrio phage 1.209.O._10N.222.52.B2]